MAWQTSGHETLLMVDAGGFISPFAAGTEASAGFGASLAS